MRGNIGRWIGVPLVALVVATGPAGAAVADEEDFKATIVLWAVSVQVVGDEVLIEAEGMGHSTVLGSFTATASVSQTLVPGCDPGTGTLSFSTDGGTLELSAEALVCFTEVTGVWTVTGGSAEFAQASGNGTFTGTPSHAGQDPVVMHLEGSLLL